MGKHANNKHILKENNGFLALLDSTSDHVRADPAVHDRLMDAYWSEGRNIGEPDELRALAVEAGLDGTEVEQVLAGDTYRDRVQGLTAQAVSTGITGVPGFLLDRRLLVLGAQPREVFERAFSQLSEAPPDQ